MTNELFSAVSKNLENHEGRVLSMYPDIERVVTCGIGHALFTPMQACNIVWWRSTNELATRDDIIKAYNDVKSGTLHRALMMTHEESDRLLKYDLTIADHIVNYTFPEHETYPLYVQVALYDLAYNCGTLLPSEKHHGFPCLVAAVKRKDFSTASQECFRPQVGERRNEDTRKQFLGEYDPQ